MSVLWVGIIVVIPIVLMIHPIAHMTNICSKMAHCLVQAGCEQATRLQILKECTQEGYCKDGYCEYRKGDFTPRLDESQGDLLDFITPVFEQNCVGGCCKGPCQNTPEKLLQQRARAHRFRHEEMLLPPRR